MRTERTASADLPTMPPCLPVRLVRMSRRRAFCQILVACLRVIGMKRMGAAVLSRQTVAGIVAPSDVGSSAGCGQSSAVAKNRLNFRQRWERIAAVETCDSPGYAGAQAAIWRLSAF